ncbi:hypothetical protein [Clostridium cochlearium]|uniref:hypothetical protein n=1 Tax=Clostridium cochlearium TaxID=1494 RepID=UPI000BBBBF51|nr:hypothetical protein [Clostridium cochlearium]MBE6064012.1 hypothetical protein [Clostridium cochlearium]MBE6082861.1 hypothetical protein [Tissierellaceae bacterium]
MEKITRTISIPKDIDQMLLNISTNFFNGNYSLTLENIVKAANNNNLLISNGNETEFFNSLKKNPTLLNTIDLKSVPYNGSDITFKMNCSNNFSTAIQTALFKMMFEICQYSYRKYKGYNYNKKHFIGFKENASIYTLNNDGSLNHGVYINSLKTLGPAQKFVKTYIETNYYPAKKDRSFVFISLPELNKVNTDETVFISHLERFTRSNNYFEHNDLWDNIKSAVGLSNNSGIEFLNHVEEYLINKHSNDFSFVGKKIEALELSIDDIYKIIEHFERLK